MFKLHDLVLMTDRKVADDMQYSVAANSIPDLYQITSSHDD